MEGWRTEVEERRVPLKWMEKRLSIFFNFRRGAGNQNDGKMDKIDSTILVACRVACRRVRENEKCADPESELMYKLIRSSHFFVHRGRTCL